MKNTNTIILTPELAKRLELDLQTTVRVLIKELAYSVDLQNKSLIEKYRAHADYLAAALSTGQLTISIN